MADTIRYINPASTAGGDGTTNATSGANRAYATWAEWESNENADITGTGGHHVAYVVAGANTENRVIITGWTTDNTHRIKIMAEAGSECLGTWGTGARLEGSDSFHRVLFYEDYMEFHDIEFSQNGAATCIQYAGSTGGEILVTNCILDGANASAAACFHSNNVAQTFVLTNCICTTNYTDALDANDLPTHHWYHCTVDKRIIGRVSSALTMHNCLHIGTTAFAGFGDDIYSPAGILSGKNNYHEDADHVNQWYNGTTSGNTWSNTFTLEDEANDDYRLAAGDTSGAKTGGADISAETYGPVATDIAGNTRNQAAPTVGAFEFPAAGQPFAKRMGGVPHTHNKQLWRGQW